MAHRIAPNPGRGFFIGNFQRVVTVDDRLSRHAQQAHANAALLQRVEEFDGLVILATNLRKNIDEAFFRRMNFAIEFPLPDETNRYRIWKQHLPASAPVSSDVDFGFLARRLNITGGNIKNVVINAAFLAAANSGVIHMEHFVRAARREYEKIGRLCTEAEFAPYQAWLNDSYSQ